MTEPELTQPRGWGDGGEHGARWEDRVSRARSLTAGQVLNGLLSKGDTQVANKHGTRRSTPLDIWDMQTKTTTRDSLTPLGSLLQNASKQMSQHPERNDGDTKSSHRHG